MRRVFKVREFDRWMRKTDLTDEALCAAVVEMAAGLIDADLGGGVFKKRLALPGRGKSSGVRTLLATNQGNRWFFVYGFEKAERSNITEKELVALKLLAADLLARTSAQLDALVGRLALKEICRDIER
ncbi:MAG: type II toxin-antitoxin system RelE/ParE family toxin [Candidatus Sericytochromatia bacterium]|nr:type II toxin-antitoxin system RelE/ParE family toxin [Candidatus Sericytochromatia bacterium]